MCSFNKTGTTTATVLARAIFNEGCKAVAAGMNPMDVKRGVDKAVKLVLENLKSMAEPVNSKDSIFKVKQKKTKSNIFFFFSFWDLQNKKKTQNK